MITLSVIIALLWQFWDFYQEDLLVISFIICVACFVGIDKDQKTGTLYSKNSLLSVGFIGFAFIYLTTFTFSNFVERNEIAFYNTKDGIVTQENYGRYWGNYQAYYLERSPITSCMKSVETTTYTIENKQHYTIKKKVNSDCFTISITDWKGFLETNWQNANIMLENKTNSKELLSLLSSKDIVNALQKDEKLPYLEYTKLPDRETITR